MALNLLKTFTQTRLLFFRSFKVRVQSVELVRDFLEIALMSAGFFQSLSLLLQDQQTKTLSHTEFSPGLFSVVSLLHMTLDLIDPLPLLCHNDALVGKVGIN